MINQKRVAVFSDLHIGVHNNSSQWHDIALEWAHWFVADVKSKGITDVLFCGDWHHNRSEISVDTLHISAEILDIFKDLNLIMILGNHDIFHRYRTDVHSMSVFRRKHNITIFEKPTKITAFGRTLQFCPWNTSIDEIEKCDVIFGHFEIVSFKMNTFKVCEEGMRIPDLIDRSSLVFSGHFHLRNERHFDTGIIIYTGNPFQMDFGDAGNDKGYYILDIETLKYEFVPNTVSPQYTKITLSELIKTPAILDSTTRNIVRLKIDKNISQDDLSTLVTYINAKQPESLTVDYDVNFNQLLSSEVVETDLSGIDIPQAIEEFINLLDIDQKTQIIEYTLDLFRRSNT